MEDNKSQTLTREQMEEVDQKHTEATEATDEETMDEKSLAMEGSDDNTHLRLDTVWNVKSKSDDGSGEEKKDDYDDDYDPAVIEEPTEDMITPTLVAEESQSDEAVVEKIPDSEPEKMMAEDEPKEQTAEEATETRAVEEEESSPEPEKETESSQVQKESPEGVPEAESVVEEPKEEPIVVEPAAEEGEETKDNDAAPAATYSVDSDHPTGEAEVTTHATCSTMDDSDAPDGEAEITTKSTSMTEAPAEKFAKAVQFAEETVVSMKSSGDSSLLEAPVVQESAAKGFFSCGAPLCGTVNDVVESEPIMKDEDFKATPEEAETENSEESKSTTLAEPTITEKVPTTPIVEGETPGEEGAKEGLEQKDTEPVAEEENNQEDTPTGSVEEETGKDVPLNSENKAELATEIAEEEAPLIVEDKAELATEVADTKDEGIVDGPESEDLLHLKHGGTSFDIQQGYSCSTVFICGGLLPSAKPEEKKVDEDLRMTLSQDLIMEAREEGEKELDFSQETSTVNAEAAEETSGVTVETGAVKEPSEELPKDEGVEEPLTDKKATEELLKESLSPIEQENMLDKPLAEDKTSEQQPAEEKETVQLPTDTEEQPVVESTEKADENIIAEQPASFSPKEDPAPEKQSDEQDAPTETEVKETEVATPQPVATTPELSAAKEDGSSPVTPEKPLSGTIVNEEEVSRAQQEAYSCGNQCTIL